MTDDAEILTLPLSDDADLTGSPGRSEKIKSERQEFFLPVSGFVWFYREEVAVMDHPAFQRLSRINQLGQAYYVFRGATHKRIEHVMGAVHVAERMISAVNSNAEEAARIGDETRCAGLNKSEQRFIRLGALLHDIGHLACGHTLEDELGLFDQHDEDERLSLVFGKREWPTAYPVPTLAELIDEEYRKFVPDDLAAAGLSATDIVRLIIRKKPSAHDDFEAKQDALSKCSLIRVDVCENMVGNTICADLLDYIYRDWYHLGKVLPQEDRIFQYMEVRNPDARKYDAEPDDAKRRSESDKFVIVLGATEGDTPKVRTDGVSAILNLLENRYQLAETVLYHRTKLAAAAMLDRALYELWGVDSGAGAGSPADLLMLSDEQLVDHARAAAAGKSPAAEKLLAGLTSRQLHRVLVSIQHSSHGAFRGENLIRLLSDGSAGAAHRANFARAIEADFRLPAGSIVLGYSDVKAKIAEVQVRVDTTIKRFCDFETDRKAEDKAQLAGGHLDAQIQRFKALRRVDFFLAKDVWADLERSEPETVTDIVDLIRAALIQGDGAEAAQRSVARIAGARVAREVAKGANHVSMRDSREVQRLAAKSDPRSAGLTYPNGVIALRAYIDRRQ